MSHAPGTRLLQPEKYPDQKSQLFFFLIDFPDSSFAFQDFLARFKLYTKWQLVIDLFDLLNYYIVNNLAPSTQMPTPSRNLFKRN